jgi:hypothetical protein
VYIYLNIFSKTENKIDTFGNTIYPQWFTLYMLWPCRRGPRPPGKPNIAVRAVGHVFQYWIIYHSLAPSKTPPQSAARRRLLICISSRSNFKRQHNIIIIYIVLFTSVDVTEYVYTGKMFTCKLQVTTCNEYTVYRFVARNDPKAIAHRILYDIIYGVLVAIIP